MYYYIDSAGQQAGPVPADQLAANGVTANTLVWKEGISQWTKASDVPELRYLFDPTVPPPPPSNSTNTADSQDDISQLKTYAKIVCAVSTLVMTHWIFFGCPWLWFIVLGFCVGWLLSIFIKGGETAKELKIVLWVSVIVIILGYVL